MQENRLKQKVLEAIKKDNHSVPKIAKYTGESTTVIRRLIKIMAAERLIALTNRTPPYFYCELIEKDFAYHDPFNLSGRSRRVLAEDQDATPDLLPTEATEQNRGSNENSRRNGNDCFSSLSYYQTRYFEGYGQPKQLRDIL